MRLLQDIKDKNANGFTIIELLVIAPVVLLTIGAFITVIVNMTGDVLAARTSTLLAYNVQSALNQINSDVTLSSTFLAQTNLTQGPTTTLPLTTPQGYGDDTTPFNNVDSANGDMLILSTLATTSNPISTSVAYIYLNNLPNSCTSNQASQNTPMTYNIVYFVKNNTLWRRVIMPSNYASVGCNLPWQQPSCNPVYMTNNPGAPSAFCATKDQDLLDNINTSGFNIQYFNTASSATPNTVATDTSCSPIGSTACVASRNAALQSLATVSASITVNTTAAGRAITQSGTIRSTRLGTSASTIPPVVAVAPSIPSAPSGVAATFNSPGTITVNWYPNATTYNLQYSTSSTFSSPTTISNITSASKVITNLNGSPTYYFRVQSTNSAGTSGWSQTASQSSTITNGLIGWWRFNGNATDSSNYNNTGVISGPTLTTGQNGSANGAYKFTAATQTILTNSMPSVSTTATFAAWINPTSYPSERYTIMEGLPISTAWYLSLNTDGSLQTYWYSKSSPGYFSSGASTVPLNQWTYVVATWGATSAQLYVNGVLKSATQSTGTGGAATGVNFGAESAARQYMGSIDDARVYNRDLSAGEILSLYNAGAQ